MNNYIHEKKPANIILALSFPLIVVFINVCIIFFPKESIEAAKEGVILWYSNVLPSLLPFIIGINLMSATGVISFFGSLTEPLMIRLFNVPGQGGFALVSGLLSGYPMGAKVTAELLESNEINQDEASRLMTFANNSGPLFIIGAIGSGLLNSIWAGYFLLIIHYLSSLSVGILFRSYRRPPKIKSAYKSDMIKKAINSLVVHRQKNKNKIGVLLGTAVINGIETILMIGGFIILFSVVTKILDITNIFYFIQVLLNPITTFLKLPEDLVKGIISGIIEMTNGLKIISQQGITKESLAAAAAILSWGGFSIHAQSLSFFKKHSANTYIYFSSKILSAFLAVVYSLLAFPLFRNVLQNERENVFMQTDNPNYLLEQTNGVVDIMKMSIVNLGVCILIMICIALIIGVLSLFVNGIKYKKGKNIAKR